ncbi:hypothetical protein OAV67_00225 [Alphaproteobacteria bacterium]|nr:hypothetical protein [Alphaproteobacteria bacterium]
MKFPLAIEVVIDRLKSSNVQSATTLVFESRSLMRLKFPIGLWPPVVENTKTSLLRGRAARTAFASSVRGFYIRNIKL